MKLFALASLLAFILEIAVFNYPSHLRHFSGAEFHTLEVSPQDSTILFTTDPTVSAKRIFKPKITQDSRGNIDSVSATDEIVFENLDRRITSLHIRPVFRNNDFLALHIRATDETDTRGFTRFLHDGFPHDNHIPVQYFGKVSKLSVQILGDTGEFSQITVNKPIPFYFSGLRILVIACLFFVIILCASRKFRARAIYFLFEYKFNPADKKQKFVYAFMVILVLLFSGISAFTSTSKFWQEYVGDWQYNIFLVDALLAGRPYLDVGRPEMLQVAERPYDLQWLWENGFGASDWWYGDWAYYNGKFYSYFGIVPAIILFAPWKLITGDYLPNYVGIFIFMAISIILMAMLWRHCVKKYMPGTRFIFYLLGFLALFFASALFGPLRFTRFYSIVSSGGFMFTIAGILLLLKSVARERPNGLKLFFACLCFALAVGCRPNLVFVSILVPVVLWKYRSFKTAALIMIPYIIVAIPLCYYNYIRFGSIFDFGVNYNLTNINTSGYNLLNPIDRILNTFVNFLSYIFSLNTYSHLFPYVECHPVGGFINWAPKRFYDKGVGIINFPIVFFWFLYFKNLFAKNKIKPQTFYLSTTFLAIAAITILLNSWLIGVSGRYIIDYAFFLILPSIFYAYYWCNGQPCCNNQTRNRLKITYTLLVVSIFVGLFLFATDVTNDQTPSNPVLYRYLQYSLGFVNNF
ncbi:MAG: hypothetical protein LBU83_13890 [Bacteroidales bacterium]|nr:hypothetical protein [Bacteroidales bacterium]